MTQAPDHKITLSAIDSSMCHVNTGVALVRHNWHKLCNKTIWYRGRDRE